MTRAATATAWNYFEQDTTRDNVVDFSAYRSQKAMEVQHYVLVPVEPPQPEPSYTPRPRRNHRNAEVADVVHTALNLTTLVVIFVFTALISGMM